MDGYIKFSGYDYTYRYNKEANSLELHTQDKKSKLKVEFICKETSDTERRWREFHHMFAQSVAKKHFGITHSSFRAELK